MTHKKGKGFTGFKHTKENKEKFRQIALKRFKNPKNHPMFGTRRNGKNAPNFGNFQFNILKKELYDLYSNKKLSMSKIAKVYNCSYDTIRRRLIKYKIPVRTQSEVNKLSSPLRMRNRRSYEDKNNPNFGNKYAKKYYCICGKKISYRSKMCKDCYLEYNNPMKTLEARSKESLTKGGTGIPYENSDYPSEFLRIRYKILGRDNHTCQKCNKYTNEIHHIDYNKQNNIEENLICLCHKCNMKANKDRDYWFAYYSYIIKERKCH